MSRRWCLSLFASVNATSNTTLIDIAMSFMSISRIGKYRGGQKRLPGRPHLARLFPGESKKNCTRLCRDARYYQPCFSKSDRSVTVSWKRFKPWWLIRQQESSSRYTYREQTTLMNSQRRGCVSSSRDWERADKFSFTHPRILFKKN